MSRIKQHPILPNLGSPDISFFFRGQELLARQGEMITSALLANDISVFGHHQKDKHPRGIFCANGQCAQCLVIADGLPVKGCMVPITEGMRIEPCEGVPLLPEADLSVGKYSDTEVLRPEVLVIGGGPSGLMAALELAPLGVKVLVIDDKHTLGGKLVLQTHSFFGSKKDVYAGTRGIDIAAKLAAAIEEQPNIDVMLDTTAVACFSDKRIGVVQGNRYLLIEPEKLLIASGAREKALSFSGSDLPGVYGAGAFQTLVNRDLVRSTDRLFIVGGGNVGLIAAYHALQAGIEVVGLVEALPQVGGYKVHQDKIKRLGVSVYTSHTVLLADGKDKVEGVTIAQVDTNFQILKNTEKNFAVDTILIAVGLSPVDELYAQARQFGMDVFSAGDAREIAEASAAIFSGKISGRQIAQSLGHRVDIPEEWQAKFEVMKRRPGKEEVLEIKKWPSEVFPAIRCVQKIPCDPCTHVCPRQMIELKGDSIFDLPYVTHDECTACGLCVAVCPGLAITIVDLRPEGEMALVTVPYELLETTIHPGDRVDAVGMDGEYILQAEVAKIKKMKKAHDRTMLVSLSVPKDKATLIAGIVPKQKQSSGQVVRSRNAIELHTNERMICKCERVGEKKIRDMIHHGVRDMNQFKVLRAGMGSCGGKTCQGMIEQLFKQEGVDLKDVTGFTQRPLVAEVELGVLAGEEKKKNK